MLLVVFLIALTLGVYRVSALLAFYIGAVSLILIEDAARRRILGEGRSRRGAGPFARIMATFSIAVFVGAIAVAVVAAINSRREVVTDVPKVFKSGAIIAFAIGIVGQIIWAAIVGIRRRKEKGHEKSRSYVHSQIRRSD